MKTSLLRAASLIATACLATAVHAASIPSVDLESVQLHEPQRDFKAETDLYCLALAVYFEDGSTTEDLEGQRYIARVVTQRTRANLSKWGGHDLCDVVFYKRAGVCQFSFACLPLARRTPRGGARWEQAMQIASEELNAQADASDAGIRYYMNPALTSDRNACRFRKEFVPVLEAGRHQFFREPTEAERRKLASSEPVECRRYKTAQELKLRELKQKRAAAEKRRKVLRVNTVRAKILRAKAKRRYADTSRGQ
jgi:hypothetical protein